MSTNFDAPLGSQTSFDSTAPHNKPDYDEYELELEQPEGAAEPDGTPIDPAQLPFDSNLAPYLEENVKNKIVGDLIHDIRNDFASREDWAKAYVEGLKLLGLKYEKRTEPWQDACGVFHPMLTEAVVKFQSETILETFPAKGPVRTSIVGDETPELLEAAKRVENDMNYKLTETMPEFRPEHERMLWHLAIAGAAFKKVYFDPMLGRQTSMFAPAEDIIVSYGTSELQAAERVTHRMRKSMNEMAKLQQAKFYDPDVDLGQPLRGGYPDDDEIQDAKDKQTGSSSIWDERFLVYEVQCFLDLEGFEDKDALGVDTEIALPYIVTIERTTSKLLAVYRNWEENDKLKLPRQHFVQYTYIPGFGAYGFGLVHLIGGYSRSATSITRQLVDAGTLSNLPGGLKTRGLRIKGDDTPIAPGEFRDVEIMGGALKDNLMMLPYKEPSMVLFQLMQNMVADARSFASTADMKVSDMSAQAPVGTTLAIIERMLKVMSAVQARVHFSLKQELKLLAKIIKDNTPDEYPMPMDGKGGTKAKKADYANVAVIPCSDPNASTTTQRIAQYQVAMQLSSQAPEIYNKALLHQSMLTNIGMSGADKIVPLPDQMQPVDPVTENMSIIKGAPVKAFPTQNHEAHIQVHMAALQDPKIMQMVGQSPSGQGIQNAMQAHLQEHLAYAYRTQIEQQLGHSLPPADQPMDPKMQAQLEMPLAQAAQKLLQQNQTQAANDAAQQAAQDPVLQLQQQDQALKQQELERKKQKDENDLLVQAAKLILEYRKHEQDKGEHEDDQFQTGMQMGHTMAQHLADRHHEAALKQADRTHDATKTGFGHGVELMKTREGHQHAAVQAALKPPPAPPGKGKPNGKSK